MSLSIYLLSTYIFIHIVDISVDNFVFIHFFTFFVPFLLYLKKCFFYYYFFIVNKFRFSTFFLYFYTALVHIFSFIFSILF